MRVTGSQPGIFRGKTGFLEQGHFDKHFVWHTKEGLMVLFLQDTLKTAFEMRT